ncbi:hypothetical protein AAG906_013676 [Vitis piasezkii]
MEVQILSRKLIKPSSPTPSHLRTWKLSPIDQLVPQFKPAFVFYYPAHGTSSKVENVERCQRLEKSLPGTLTRFYPLAGTYIKDSHSVECNDQGAEYLEAKVDAQLTQLLSKKDEIIEEVIHFAGGKFTSPLITIQTTMFECGGLVIDNFAMFQFGFSCLRKTYQRSSPASPKIHGAEKLVTMRFVFDGANISSLKAKAKANSETSTPGPGLKPQVSRVEVVTSLIWGALIRVSLEKHGRLRTSLAVHSANLRGKIVPALPDNCCGNLYRLAAARFVADDSKMELPSLADLVGLVSGAIRTETLSQEDVFPTAIKSFNEVNEELGKEEVDVRMFTSWCSGCATPVEMVSLQDTECGDGIEAWVSLKEHDMLQFQSDANLTAFTSRGPA